MGGSVESPRTPPRHGQRRLDPVRDEARQLGALLRVPQEPTGCRGATALSMAVSLKATAATHEQPPCLSGLRPRRNPLTVGLSLPPGATLGRRCVGQHLRRAPSHGGELQGCSGRASSAQRAEGCAGAPPNTRTLLAPAARKRRLRACSFPRCCSVSQAPRPPPATPASTTSGPLGAPRRARAGFGPRPRIALPSEV
jgi:hypothetical protein